VRDSRPLIQTTRIAGAISGGPRIAVAISRLARSTASAYALASTAPPDTVTGIAANGD
jgi:hypothetical protein